MSGFTCVICEEDFDEVEHNSMLGVDPQENVIVVEVDVCDKCYKTYYKEDGEISEVGI